MQFWIWFSGSVLVNERFGSVAGESIKTIRMRPNAAKKITSFMILNFASFKSFSKSSGLAKFFAFVPQTVSRLRFITFAILYLQYTRAQENYVSLLLP